MYVRRTYNARIIYGPKDMSSAESRYEIRVESTLKEAFLKAAKRNDRDGAQLIRDFMREFVKANPEPEPRQVKPRKKTP